ncbi:MAG: hypothetical protein RLZZ488_1778 [Pseudomonadota bacterium]|jgi:bacterioferritin-associated ferredoxin
MKFMKQALPVILLTTLGCTQRTYNTLENKDKDQKKTGLAVIAIESTSVRQLTRVIGIEKEEASCVGGNPKHTLQVKSSEKIEIEVPVTVTKIGLCGQATPTGMDYKHIPVALKEGQKVIIKNDVPTTPIAAGFARVRIESTTVRQLTRVIGVEKSEASCVGGAAKFQTDDTAKMPIEIDLPVSVTKIGLCGQGTPTGMDYKHISVALKDGEMLTIANDEVKK